jgi:site-specific DNA recombinase
MKALVVIRLSRVTDATTSPERQLQACLDLCQQRGYEVVGIAEDLDVSAGSTSPFDRPALSHWIGNDKDDPGRVGEFDVIVFYRVDRLVRRVKHLNKLIDWSEERGVNLVSATESHFDLSTPIGRIIAQLVASFAEMELEAISERIASTARHNIKAGKYRGGIPPWGYLPDNSTGEWRYVQDPEQVKVIHEIVERVLAGESLRSVARDLTVRGVPTQRDRFAQSRGKELAGREWHLSPLKRSLMSKTLLGHTVIREVLKDSQGRALTRPNGNKKYGPEDVVRNEDGSPMVRATPILTREVFDRLQAELASRGRQGEPTEPSSSLLLRVIFCGVCGDKPMYRLKGGRGRSPRYRCASAQSNRKKCVNLTASLPEADDVVTRLVLAMFGESDRLERVWEAGSDHSAELAELDATLADLTGLVGTGPYRAGTAQRETLDRRIEALAARQAALSSEAVRPAGWVWRSTGEKFSVWWDKQDVQARNVWLRSMGIRLEFDSRPGKTRWHVSFEEMDRMGEHMELAGSGADYARLLNEMRKAGIAGIEMNGESGIQVHWADTAHV